MNAGGKEDFLENVGLADVLELLRSQATSSMGSGFFMRSKSKLCNL